MTMASMGDLAQSLLLRRSVASTQTVINHALRDVSSGQASDAAAHLRGQTAPLSAIDAALSRNKALGETLKLAEKRAEVMQTSLSHIDGAAREAAQSLMSASQTANPTTLRLASRLASQALDTVVSALNQNVFGQGVFSGTATDRPAIASAEEILADARTAIAGALSSTDAATRLDTWFADPDGFARHIDSASPEHLSIPLGPGESVTLPVTSHDPLFRSTLKGLLLGSLMSDAAFANSPSSLAQLAGVSAETLYASSEPRSELASRLGLAESRIAQTSTRITAENTALGIARNDLLAIDSFETATRLTEAETRLEQLFAITARLERLSLAEYMR